MRIKDNSLPIYRQIVTAFEYDIASKKLLPGERLSSIRDLALIYKVNPNTMARALSILEDSKLIYTDRTNGKYVVEDEERLKILKTQLLGLDTKEYLQKVKHLKMTREDVKQLIDELWEDDDE